MYERNFDVWYQMNTKERVAFGIEPLGKDKAMPVFDAQYATYRKGYEGHWE